MAVAAVLLLLVVPTTVEGQTANRPEIVSLNFEGNASFPDRSLRNAIITRQTDCRSFILTPFCWVGSDFALDRSFLNPRSFRDDYARVQLFYYVRGYRQARVDTIMDRSEENRVRVTYRIDEGRPIRITELEVAGVEDEAARAGLDASLPIGVGDPLDLNRLDFTRDTITRRMRNRGYAHTDVLRNIDIDLERLEAQVEYDVYTGPRAHFGEIRIEGNEEVSERVIRRMIPFEEGQTYNRELIFDAQRALYNLEIFRHASVEEDLEHVPDSIVPLQVTVNEGNTHRVRTGAGWNSAECFTAETRWSSRNFQGGARRLVLRSALSNVGAHQLEDSICSGAGTGVYGDLNWSLSADFRQPFIFSPRNSLSASLFAERQSLQDVFVRQAVGVNLTLTRQIGRGTPLSVFYRPQLARLEAAEVFFCTTFLVCDPDEIDILQDFNLLSPVGVAFSRDRTNRAFSPTGGYTVLADLEHASRFTGSNFDYERLVVETTRFFSITDDIVLAARIRGGRLWAGSFRGLGVDQDDTERRIAHPQKRFFAGGANSVRGYAQNQLGPQVVSVDLDDLIFPVGDRPDPICAPSQVANLSCDPDPLEEDRFFSRPAGGANLLEGSAELRFPVWQPHLRGAAFVDFGQVWDNSANNSLSDVVVAPGVGLRYSTPIGPVRIDVAYRPRRTEQVPVITSGLRAFDPDRDRPEDRIVDPDGQAMDWVRQDDRLLLLDPRLTLADEPGFSLRRLQLHFSIGQAF